LAVSFAKIRQTTWRAKGCWHGEVVLLQHVMVCGVIVQDVADVLIGLLNLQWLLVEVLQHEWVFFVCDSDCQCPDIMVGSLDRCRHLL
jgi:hypothetical protein